MRSKSSVQCQTQGSKLEKSIPTHPAGGSVDSVDFAPCSKFCLLGELLPAAIFKGTSM